MNKLKWVVRFELQSYCSINPYLSFYVTFLSSGVAAGLVYQ